MSRIVITGAAGALGRRVTELAAADPAVDRVLAIDVRPVNDDEPPTGIERDVVDLLTADVKPLLHQAATVVHLASVWGPALDDDPAVLAGAEVEMARRVLEAASDAAVDHVVVLSSATVYGAWPNNPVPLTEDAPLKPNPDCAFAVQKAEIERLATEWADAHPSSTVLLLRPAAIVSDDRIGWLAQALASAPSPVGDDEPPGQYLELDDLATAVDQARRNRLDGPVNVAPDGWLDGDERKALASGTPRLRAPAEVAGRLARFRWRWRLAPTPPGVVPYRWHSWVVATDRLKATGWEPRVTNEEAYVAGHAAGAWATLSPQRRQELALGVVGASLVATAAGAAALIRRRQR